MHVWIRSAIILLATGFVGFIGAWQASNLVSWRGVLGPTIFQSITPLSSVLAVFFTVLVAAFVGGFVAKISSAITGMFILGFSLFAMAMRLEGMQELVMSEGNFNALILESAFLCVIVLLGTIIVFAIGGPLRCISKTSLEDRIPNQLGKAILISFAILPVIWIIANTAAKGQVIGASAVGGLAIALLSRKFLHSMQPILLFALPIACGGVGYFIGMLLSDPTPSAFAQQKMSPLLFPMPIEYAGGIILGLAIGLGWTSSEESASSELAKKVPQ